MHVSPEQLQSNLEALDSGDLLARVHSGALPDAALQVALGILKARGVDAGPRAAVAPPALPTVPATAPRKPWPGGSAVRVLLGLYVVFVVLCTFVVFMDPPWVPPRNGTWGGMIGFLASLAAGAPWSFLMLVTQADRLSQMQFVMVDFACVALNLVLFGMYIRRT
jgi:hypothetical protein